MTENLLQTEAAQAHELAQLKVQARAAAAQSYSPYSQFKVGVALSNQDGKVFTGVNVENASYGLTLCAERNAIFAAVTQGSRSLRQLVVYTPTQEPTPPCGACRQVIREFSADVRVVSICDSDQELDFTIEQLLPGSFDSSNLDAAKK